MYIVKLLLLKFITKFIIKYLLYVRRIYVFVYVKKSTKQFYGASVDDDNLNDSVLNVCINANNTCFPT